MTGLIGGDFFRPVKKANPGFDPKLREEGITCASCHVRNGFVLTARPPLRTPPHPSRVDAPSLSAQMCVRCHNARANVTDTLVCAFDTGDDWKQTDLPAQGVTCIDCHLPPVDRGARTGRGHAFLGAGIGKELGLQKGRTGLHVSVDIDRRGYQPGATATLRATVSNAHAGHSIPTGDVERWTEVRFRVTDASGAELWTHTQRFGERWEWHPKARQLEDSSLRRGHSQTVELGVPIPAAPTGKLSLEAIVTNHRMTEQTHKWAQLPSSYPLSSEAAQFRWLLPIQ